MDEIRGAEPLGLSETRRSMDRLEAYMRDAAARPAFAEAARLVTATIGLSIDESTIICVLAGGELKSLSRTQSTDPVDFTVSGPADEWLRLIVGTIDYANATNIAHGRLRITGNPVKAAASNFALYTLLSRPRISDDPIGAATH